jgi:DHA2 family multidrug resistance protein
MFGSTFLLPVYLQTSLGYTALQAGSVFLPVGIIQGITGPISGRLADKINPKVPIIIGVLLLALSFYINSKLSYLTELHYIMLSLYIRGLGMGLLFTALSAISLTEIPREKMAQASAISNSLRQLGGSLGVALLATLLTTRVSYHTQVFGGEINRGSEVFQQSINGIKTYAMHNAGSSPADAAKVSQFVMMSHISRQAYVEGINDDFLLAALITLAGGLPIIFLHTKKQKLQTIPAHE